MKNLNLDAYGVEEMNQQEMVNVDGGFLFELIIAYNVLILMALSTPAY